MAPPTPTDELVSTLIKVRCGTQSYSLLPPRSLPDSESHSPRRPIAPSRECASTFSWSGSGVLNSVQMMHRVPCRKPTPTRLGLIRNRPRSWTPYWPKPISTKNATATQCATELAANGERARRQRSSTLKTSEARRPSRFATVQPSSSAQLSLRPPQSSSPSTVVSVLSNPVQSDGPPNTEFDATWVADNYVRPELDFTKPGKRTIAKLGSPR